MSFPKEVFLADTGGSRAILICACLFPILATFFVIGRFISRKLGKIPYGPDDWLVLAAVFPVWGQNAMILITIYHGGIGQEYADVPAENRELLFKCLTIVPITFGVALGLTKCSIILLLRRIFATPKFRKFANLLLGYIISWTVMAILTGSLICRPLAKSWDPTVPGQCANLIAAHIAVCSSDVLGDIMIILLPMPKIWKLHQDTVTKLVLTLIFGIGIFDTICGLLLVDGLIRVLNTSDFTETAVNSWIWTTLEPNLAIIIACAPSLRPLYNYLRFGQAMSPGSQELQRARDEYRSKNTSNPSATQSDSKTERDIGLENVVGHTAMAKGGGRTRIDGDMIALTEMPSTFGLHSSTEDVLSNDRQEQHMDIRVENEVIVGYHPA